jgi:hypothetical protein
VIKISLEVHHAIEKALRSLVRAEQLYAAQLASGDHWRHYERRELEIKAARQAWQHFLDGITETTP